MKAYCLPGLLVSHKDWSLGSPSCTMLLNWSVLATRHKQTLVENGVSGALLTRCHSKITFSVGFFPAFLLLHADFLHHSCLFVHQVLFSLFLQFCNLFRVSWRRNLSRKFDNINCQSTWSWQSIDYSRAIDRIASTVAYTVNQNCLKWSYVVASFKVRLVV